MKKKSRPDLLWRARLNCHEFKNVDVVVPFAVVFSDTGKDTKIMLTNSDGDDCYVPIPTRIMNKLSKQVYSYLFDKIPHSMRMLHADCDKQVANTKQEVAFAISLCLCCVRIYVFTLPLSIYLSTPVLSIYAL